MKFSTQIIQFLIDLADGFEIIFTYPTLFLKFILSSVKEFQGLILDNDSGVRGFENFSIFFGF